MTYFGIGLCLLILTGTVHPVPEAQAKTQYFVWTTGGVGGTWYPLGSGIASFITKNVKGISIAAQASGGAMENLNLINSDNALFARVLFYDGQKKYLLLIHKPGFYPNLNYEQHFLLPISNIYK